MIKLLDGWQTTDLRAIRNGAYIGTERYTVMAEKPYCLNRLGTVRVIISEWNIELSLASVSDIEYGFTNSIYTITDKSDQAQINNFMEYGFTKFQMDLFMAIHEHILEEAKICYGRPCKLSEDMYRAINEAKYI